MKYRIILFLFFLSFIACEKDKDQPVELLKACFGAVPNEINEGEIQVQFSNCSENAKNYFWDFGDGTTSTDKEPLHVYEGGFPIEVTLIAYDGDKTDTIVKPVYEFIVVYKPNIYIYPLFKLDLCLEVLFPMGGEIIESIPHYSDHWCVNIDPNGKIDDQYDYLFYESKQPNIFQYEKGWCVARSEIESFFEENMRLYHFSDAEIEDFIEYWTPLLNENDYYMVYPQTNVIIDEIIQLNFSIQPDHISRLFYGVAGVDDYSQIEEPIIEAFPRDGFHVFEWGVFRK